MPRKLYLKGATPRINTPIGFELEQDGEDVNIWANYDGKRALIAFFSGYTDKTRLELMRGLDNDVFDVDDNGFLKPTL